MDITAIYPGTFDPVTLGHIDVAGRAAKMFDQLIIAVAASPGKKPHFDLAQRCDMAERVLSEYPNVRVETFTGLLVEFAKQHEASVIVRGLRAVSDFEYEFQMASANHRLDNNLETIFLTPSESNYFISSSLVREISRYGGDVSSFVSASVNERLKIKWANQP